jgi:hypothetical protein
VTGGEDDKMLTAAIALDIPRSCVSKGSRWPSPFPLHDRLVCSHLNAPYARVADDRLDVDFDVAPPEREVAGLPKDDSRFETSVDDGWALGRR